MVISRFSADGLDLSVLRTPMAPLRMLMLERTLLLLPAAALLIGLDLAKSPPNGLLRELATTRVTTLLYTAKR